jgi:hypothetical protein
MVGKPAQFEVLADADITPEEEQASEEDDDEPPHQVARLIRAAAQVGARD